MKQNKTYAANNCRALTPDELVFVNGKYKFWIEGDDVCVMCANRHRVTRHSKHDKFAINIKKVRKITYSSFAIELFEKLQQNDSTKKYTLTDIQNTATILRLTYQPVNESTVLSRLQSTK